MTPPTLRGALLLAASLSLAAGAAAQPAATPLSIPAAEAIARGYLQEEQGALGLAPGDLDELRVSDAYATAHSGATHLHLRQRIGGIEVFGAVVSLTLDSQGRVVFVGDRLLRALLDRPGRVPGALSAAQALAAAALHLGLVPPATPELRRRLGGPAREQVFAPGGLSRDEIPARLEYVPLDARLRLAWNLVIRTPDGRHWWNLHVDAADGHVLRQDDWIDRDSYRVWPPPRMSPDEGPRQLVPDPADPVASPFGWHDTNGVPGAEFTDTRGNNVFAQDDLDGDDDLTPGHRPDGGAGLDFDSSFDPAQQPSGNRDASITNLFYWNNRVHDVLYHHGFDEPAGNFQQNNYGNGGIGGDPVQADALDGSDLDNAQFSTPPDGIDGRMEMFRWEQSPAPRLDIQPPSPLAGSYSAGKALFGTGTSGLTADVVAALDPADAAGPSTTDACSPLVNPGAVAGHIAFVDRGDCFFVDKVNHAQDAGAIGVIVANNTSQAPQVISMAGVDPGIAIPSVFVSQADGNAIRGQLGVGVSATLVSPADRDSALDNAIVVHEYGHGVTNRLTGGPGSVSCLDVAQGRGMGEGWSDWLALVFTAEAADQPGDARSVAPYLEGQPPSGPGIRNHPYSTDLGLSPLTYGDLPGLNQPHGVGEVWAAALWEVYWNLVDAYGFDPDLIGGDAGNQRALRLVIDGLKMQPCDPTFVDGRDALLAADSLAYGGANACLIWKGFARRGIGVSADDGRPAQTVSVSEAFDVPEECELPAVPALPPAALPTLGLALALAAGSRLRRPAAPGLSRRRGPPS